MIRSLFLSLVCLLAVTSVARAQALRPEEVLGQDRLVTLDEAVAMALENNLGLQVERLDPALAQEQVRESWGAFEPNLVGTYDREHVETPIASTVIRAFGTSGKIVEEDYYTYNGGLQGILPWGIGYSSGYTMQILDSTSGLYALAPQYGATWRSELTVPLLRNLYWSTPDLLVRRSRVSQQISDENFNARLSDTVLRVEGLYWQLAATRALKAAAERSVETAKDLLELTKVQYQVGVVSKVRVTEAESILSQRDFSFIVSTNNAEAAQDDLLTVILAPGMSGYADTKLRTEEPTFVPYDVNAEASLQKARELRPELVAAQKAVENSEFDEKYAWNQKLPALDVRGIYTNNGLAGSQKVQPGIPTFVDNPLTPGFDSVEVPTPDLGYGQGRWSADNQFLEGDGAHSWGVQANLVVPIGNDTLDARYVKSKIFLRRAKTNLRIQEQSIVVDVRNAVRELTNSIDGVKTAQRGRVLAEETLRAEQERLRLGDSTPHSVSEFQDDLLEAESNEIRALQRYRTAIAALERAQGTLLEKFRIDVVNERERGVGDF